MEDATSDPDYDRRHTIAGNWRRMLGVPMLRDGKPIGAIVVAWPEAGPVIERHVELLQTFADQAVIAIENVRLFKELEERNAEVARGAGASDGDSRGARHHQPLADGRAAGP